LIWADLYLFVAAVVVIWADLLDDFNLDVYFYFLFLDLG
jgi:hypothetical protein